jgi:hypothetical protein
MRLPQSFVRQESKVRRIRQDSGGRWNKDDVLRRHTDGEQLQRQCRGAFRPLRQVWSNPVCSRRPPRTQHTNNPAKSARESPTTPRARPSLSMRT